MANFEARKVLMKDAQGRYVIPFTGAVETVNGQKPDENGNVVIEGVDTTTLLTKAVAAETYLSKADASTTYLNVDTAAGTFLSKTDAASTYLKAGTAADTFLSKADASSTYLTQAQANSAYLGVGDKAVSAETADNAVSATMASKAISDINGNAIATTYATNQNLFSDGGAGSLLRSDIMPIQTVDGYAPDASGNIDTCSVKTVNSKNPDASGNVDIPARNVGDEWHSFTGQIPAGGVPYCGQIVTRETYADLWDWVQAQGLVKTEDEWQSLATSQNGNVPFYSDGDGSTTFRMPKVVGYIKGAVSQSEAGTYTAEGLPNITGTIPRVIHYDTASGAFEDTGTTGNRTGTSGSTDIAVSFDASRSNPIYGNSDHVTPETAIVLFGVYAFGEITNVGALDADTLATGLATVEANLEEKEQVVSTGSNYVRLKSGYQICYGSGFKASGLTAIDITFQAAFIALATPVVSASIAALNVGSENWGKTGFTIKFESSGASYYSWFAFGKWK